MYACIFEYLYCIELQMILTSTLMKCRSFLASYLSIVPLPSVSKDTKRPTFSNRDRHEDTCHTYMYNGKKRLIMKQHTYIYMHNPICKIIHSNIYVCMHIKIHFLTYLKNFNSLSKKNIHLLPSPRTPLE